MKNESRLTNQQEEWKTIYNIFTAKLSGLSWMVKHYHIQKGVHTVRENDSDDHTTTYRDKRTDNKKLDTRYLACYVHCRRLAAEQSTMKIWKQIQFEE